MRNVKTTKVPISSSKQDHLTTTDKSMCEPVRGTGNLFNNWSRAHFLLCSAFTAILSLFVKGRC